VTVPRTPTDDQAIAVVVAEAHRLVRAGLRLLLECDRGIVVVGEAARGEHAVAEARRLRPHVVLMDIGVPGLYALRATRGIFDDRDARARVLLLAGLESDEEALAAVRAGAHGVLSRDGAPEALRRAVRTVAAGGAVLTSHLTRRLAAEAVSGRAGDGIVPPELAVLTRREREVLGLVARGFGNGEIAARLAVTPATVKTHIGSALTKLDARDRAELVTLAYETGFVVPSA